MTGRRELAEALRRALRNTPDLPAAACRGRGALFDPVEVGEPIAAVRERHALALSLCEDCPERPRCAKWAETVPRGALAGVVAGQLRTPPPRATRSLTNKENDL